MSHEGNVTWLDAMYEKFNDTLDGRKRAYILQQLKENGFTDDAATLVEIWYEHRQKYLETIGVKEADVLIDDEEQLDPKEYYMSEEENGTSGEEGYSVDWKRHDLPEYLDVEHWANYTYPYTKEIVDRLELNA